MTTAIAPYPNYNGIPYNPAFFASSKSSSLTQSTADTRYLIKGTADTATAQETFSSGIVASSIAVGTSGKDVDTSTSTTSLKIGTAAGTSILMSKSGNTTSIQGSINFGSADSQNSMNGTTILNAYIRESGGLSVGGASTAFCMINGNAGSNTQVNGGVYKPAANSVAKHHYVYSYCSFGTYIYLDYIGVNGQTITVFNNNTSNRACWLYVQYQDTATASPTTSFLWSPPTVAGGSVYNYTTNQTIQAIQVPLYSCLTFTYFANGIATTGGFSNLWVRTG